MFTRRNHALLFSLFLGATISPGAGQTASGPLDVKVVVSGTAYDGTPEFELTADGKSIGEAALLEPADAEQTFSFSVPDGAEEELAIVFTNDFSAEGKGDRNLFVRSLTVNGERFDGSDMESTSEVANTNGEILELYTAGEAIVRRPAEGWRTAEGEKPEVDEAVAAKQDPVTETQTDATADAVAAAQPPRCLKGNLSVVGFGNNENGVPAVETAKVEQFVAKAGAGCSFNVIGYSSMAGPVAVNTQISQARAEAVARLIRSKGVSKDRVTVRGAGPTTEFGQSAMNRRVIIQAVP